MSPPAWVLALPVRLYRATFSPLVGMHCRFQPTCSAYALEALERHGALRGGLLALWRVLRCNPWGGAGYDPPPAGACACGAAQADRGADDGRSRCNEPAP